MKTRKLILLIADAVLLIALVLQFVLKAGDKVHTFELKDEPDTIAVTTPTESFSFVKENGNWFVGDKKYPVNESNVQNIVDALMEVKVLDKVAVANNEAVAARYELSDGKNIKVVASKDGKVVRTLNLGKASTASSQSYITVDESKDIYLAGGNIKNTFDRDLSYFRTRAVYQLDKNSISAVTMTTPDGNTWTVSRNGSGENIAWTINVPDVLVDSSKATEWFNGLANISTPVWHDDADLTGNNIVKCEINTGSKIVTMDIYEIPAATEDDKPLYYGFSSETPYQFELANYSVQKFQKTVADIIQ